MLRPRTLASLAALAGLVTVAACNDTTAPSRTVLGTTPGWFQGNTVTFSYTQNFQCTPAADGKGSQATSGCELGADADSTKESASLKNAPDLFVLVPLGFTPSDPSTLHCPVAGNCVTHPATIDLSRVFGPGTGNATTPPHSHIVDTKVTPAGSNAWDIVVVGVKSQDAWNQLVAGKSLTTLQQVQAAGGATADIPTNLYLFFDVM